MGQEFIFMVNQVIQRKVLDHHLIFSMLCCMKGVVIDEIIDLLAPIPIETTHAIQIMNPFDVTHPIILPLQIPKVACYHDV